MDLYFEAKQEKGHTYCRVKGEIDLFNAKALKDKVNFVMEDSESGNLVLDMQSLKYIDSTGLGILIGIKRRLTERKGQLILVIADERIKKLFTITGLVNVFSIAGSLEEAVSKLQG